MDWGKGHYESTAARLGPAADTVLAAARLVPGEDVVDLGCGTGNAALLAAERGAHVHGIDPAQRLLEVARERARARGLDAAFLVGDAAEIPLEDAVADAVLSVFAIIFAPDARAAAAELARVCRPISRLVLSAWLPEGAIHRAMRIARAAVDEVADRAEVPSLPAGVGAQVSWHEPAALRELLAPHGFDRIEIKTHSLSFTAPSAAAMVEEQFAEHPMWIAARAVLEPPGAVDRLRAESVAVFEQANEDHQAFRVTSRYVVAVARRG